MQLLRCPYLYVCTSQETKVKYTSAKHTLARLHTPAQRRSHNTRRAAKPLTKPLQLQLNTKPTNRHSRSCSGNPCQCVGCIPGMQLFAHHTTLSQARTLSLLAFLVQTLYWCKSFTGTKHTRVCSSSLIAQH